MSFTGLNYLFICFLTISFFSFAYWYQRRRQKALRSWIKPEFWSFVIPEYSVTKFLLKWTLFGAGLFFILIALLRPQWGEHEDTVESKGMDILFVLDLSNSMLAEDVNPSRLHRAQIFVKKTLQQLPDDRVGAVGFAGQAFLAIPLTTDFGYVGEVIDSLSPNAIAQQSTDIGEAIDVAIKAFERGGSDNRKTSRAIILISDGEDFGKDPVVQAQKVKDFGAGFFSFSVGTQEGAPIPLRNDAGILQTYKKDRSGKTVLSKPNLPLMNKVADAAGGKFFELTNADDASYLLIKQLQSFHRESTKEQRQIVRIDRFQIFLGLGILFLIAWLFVAYPVGLRAGPIVLVILMLASQPASAQSLDSYMKNRQGVQQYHGKKYEESSKIFEAARSKDSDNPILEFNQATALAKGKKGDDAVFHYEEATKKALNQGDFETAAKSQYNEGLLHKESSNFNEAYHQLTNAIEMAKISNQPELEKKAREALLQASQEQQKQQQGKGDQPQDPKDQKQKSQDGKDQKDQGSEKKQQNQPPMEDGKKREFKSGTLSKDVAEAIMNDLSDREKQLYQKKMKDRKAKEVQHDKDW